MLNVIPRSLPLEPSATEEPASPSLDGVFRLGRFQAHALDNEGFNCSAVVNAHGQVLNVSWPAVDQTGIPPGALVRLTLSEWSHLDDDRPIELAGLALEKNQDAETNLFRTVPSDWSIDPRLLERGARLWAALSPGHRVLFNVVFWDSNRFQGVLALLCKK